jgi:hypothetical protein
MLSDKGSLILSDKLRKSFPFESAGCDYAFKALICRHLPTFSDMVLIRGDSFIRGYLFTSPDELFEVGLEFKRV